MTTTGRRWGKAGQRLTPDGRPEHIRALRARASGGYDHKAYAQWRQGKVIPARITQALDFRGLEGPQVDLACQAQEPEVDEWESGQRYPRWDQLVALAKTCCVPLSFFTVAHDAVPVWMTTVWCTMSGKERMEAVTEWKPPVMSYPDWVIKAARLTESPTEMSEEENHG